MWFSNHVSLLWSCVDKSPIAKTPTAATENGFPVRGPLAVCLLLQQKPLKEHHGIAVWQVSESSLNPALFIGPIPCPLAHAAKSELGKSWRWIFFGLLYLIFVKAIDYTLHFRNKNEAGIFHKICSRTPCLHTCFSIPLLLCLSCCASPSVLGTLFHIDCLILYSFRSMLFVSILSEYLQSPTPGSYSNCIPASLKMASCLFDMLMDSKMILLERPI